MTESIFAQVRANLQVLRERPAVLILAMLLTTDAVFLVLHVLHTFAGQPAHWTFDLGADRSYGEIVLYLKWVWIAALCASSRGGRDMPQSFSRSSQRARSCSSRTACSSTRGSGGPSNPS